MDIITETLDQGALLVRLSGRMDNRNAETVYEQFTALMDDHSATVIVDLTEVSYIASLGIRTFIINAKALHSRGGQLILAAPTSDVRNVLDTVGIARILPLVDSVEAAKAL